MGKDPGSPCEWLDGVWEYTGATWEWTAGGWVVPPPACHFAVPEAIWVPATGGGLLFYLPGRWYRDDGRAAACGAPRNCESPLR